MIIFVFYAFLFFVITAIEVTIFFLCVRLLVTIKPYELLVAFDEAGNKLVNATTELISRILFKIFKKDFPEDVRLAVGIIALPLIALTITRVYMFFR